MQYPSLKKFMKLNNISDKKHAKKLLDKIKENHKNKKYFTLKGW